jgi:predicted phosphohydrolase
MALFAIGDLHLSLGTNKTMEVFGGRWLNYTEKIRMGFQEFVKPEDTVVICGDFSWGMDLEEALPDLQFLDALPGRKILIKGNHDYWWSSLNKVQNLLAEHELHSIVLLQNNSYSCEIGGTKDSGGSRIAICGTRGWFIDEETGTDHDKKILRRECLRLEMSLQTAASEEKYVFLHYPPVYRNYRCEEILDILQAYKIRKCCYGHIHAASFRGAYIGQLEQTDFRLVSADYLNFIPLRIG